MLVECLKGDTIGFQGQCAVCWAEDILCTKDFCVFIALQSFFINTLANFEVGADTITSAACEEAHCEAVRTVKYRNKDTNAMCLCRLTHSLWFYLIQGNPGDFVACSGATRRRMNVTSTIERPGSQRCNIVDVDWAELFPEPHPNDS